MPSFSAESQSLLAQAHPDLIKVAEAAIRVYDFKVIESFRDRARQNQLFESGLSKLRFPGSMHNRQPSLAIDIVPFPIDWTDAARFHFLAGVFFGVASGLGIQLRWGGDWNRNGNFKDQTFVDLAHFELVGEG